MSAMTDYLEDALLNEVFRGVGFAAPSAVYIALFTAAPSDAGGGTEVSGVGYARIVAAFGAPSPAGTIKNSADLAFAVAGGSWGTITHFAVMDAISGGNMLVWGALAVAKTVSLGDIFKFLTNDLVINFA